MITRNRAESVAKESGFRKDSVEKVMSLCRILRRLDSHPTTDGAGLLQGIGGWSLRSATSPQLVSIRLTRKLRWDSLRQ